MKNIRKWKATVVATLETKKSLVVNSFRYVPSMPSLSLIWETRLTDSHHFFSHILIILLYGVLDVIYLHNLSLLYHGTQVTHYAGNVIYNVKDFTEKNAVNWWLWIPSTTNIILLLCRMNLFMISREFCTIADYQFSNKCSMKWVIHVKHVYHTIMCPVCIVKLNCLPVFIT